MDRFHCACVDLDPELAEDIETWVCKKCEGMYLVFLFLLLLLPFSFLYVPADCCLDPCSCHHHWIDRFIYFPLNIHTKEKSACAHFFMQVLKENRLSLSFFFSFWLDDPRSAQDPWSMAHGSTVQKNGSNVINESFLCVTETDTRHFFFFFFFYTRIAKDRTAKGRSQGKCCNLHEHALCLLIYKHTYIDATIQDTEMLASNLSKHDARRFLLQRYVCGCGCFTKVWRLGVRATR